VGLLPKQTEKPVYLVINADEGEPGTFKDRLIMERNPHPDRRLHPLCFALKANHCYIYIRGELFKAIKRIEQAIDECPREGYVGSNVLGSGFKCEIFAHPGAGAYICGEEMALIESLEGKPGQPRNKPPFPAHVGLFGCPTIVNNVETIAYVPWIVENGGQAYSDLGSDRNGGLEDLGRRSGSVKRPGLWELPMGIPMRYLIEECAGGMKDGKVMKGVIPGGSSCPPMLAREIDVNLDIESIKKAGSMLGTGCVTVFEEGICTVRLAQRIDALLRARELRAVHALPRRHGLAAQAGQEAAARRRHA
jgi:NADH-quinone oxidoreductase subunit F